MGGELGDPDADARITLTSDQQPQFKSEHLAEVAALATAQGIWVDVAANFALGRKQAAR